MHNQSHLNLKFYRVLAGSALIAAIVFVAMHPNCAFARDLEAAATTANTIVKRVAQISSVMGVVAGGLIMNIPGLHELGKRIAGSGLLGCVCSFGAPVFVSFMTSVFGGM